ncbi:MAG TPA: hypothetical protein VHP38_13905, partial [Ruminiclostridium sp.]|nr:hypothetical protein [Ruminiclostridium sp.]
IGGMPMETGLKEKTEFTLDRKAFTGRSLPQVISEGFKLVRGVFFKLRTRNCGKLLRVEKGVRVLKRNAAIDIGRKVQIHRHVKLSAWGNECFSEILIGNETSIGDRTEIHAGKRVEIGAGCNIAWDVCIMDRDYHKFNSPSEIIEPVKRKFRFFFQACFHWHPASYLFYQLCCTDYTIRFLIIPYR